MAWRVDRPDDRVHVVLHPDPETVVLFRHVDRGLVWYEAPAVSCPAGELPGTVAARAMRELFGAEAEVGELLYAHVSQGVQQYFFSARPTQPYAAPPVEAAATSAPAQLRLAAILGYRIEPVQLARRLAELHHEVPAGA